MSDSTIFGTLALAAWYGAGLFGAWRYLIWNVRNSAFIALFISLGPVALAMALWAEM